MGGSLLAVTSAAWAAFAGFIPWLATLGLNLVATVAVVIGTVAAAFAAYIRESTDEPHEQFLAGLVSVLGLALLAFFLAKTWFEIPGVVRVAFIVMGLFVVVAYFFTRGNEVQEAVR